MINAIGIWVLLFFSGMTLAQDNFGNAYSQSIMFQAPQTDHPLQLNINNDEKSEICRDLKEQIKELAGRPVRQNVVKERFQNECIGNN